MENTMRFKTGEEQIRWINATIQNDENSTDKELIKYFMDNGMERRTAERIISQRQYALNDPFYKITI